MIAYENDAPVGTVDFVYPDDGDAEPTTTRDRWKAATPLHEKCRQRFAVVPRDRDMALPMLEMRLTVLGDAAREAAERADFDALARLCAKARGTAQRIKEEQLRYGHPGGIERHGSVVIVDDAERGKVILQFPAPVGAQIKRWVRICGFMGSGDAATFWRLRTFRREENIALETARLCVAELARMGMKEAA
jgi:hypothetical protein